MFSAVQRSAMDTPQPTGTIMPNSESGTLTSYDVVLPSDALQSNSAENILSLRRLWMGPMDPQQFLDDFMSPSELKVGYQPPSADAMDCFNSFVYSPAEVTDEKVLANSFIAYFDHVAKDQPTLFNNMQIIYTNRHRTKETSPLRADSSIYCNCVQGLEKRPIQLLQLDVPILWKPNESYDAFTNDPLGFVLDTKQAKETLRQLTLYTDLVAQYQYRTHIFQLLMCGTKARFIRYDHAAAIVSKSFNYSEQSPLLVQFLHRLAHLTPTGLGRDVRYSINVSESDTKLAKTHLERYFKERNISHPVASLSVWDEEKKEERILLVWGHVRERNTIIGRETRAFPVYDTEAKAVKFYKEGWQTSINTPETETLRMLNQKGIPNIPTVCLGGDIPGHVTRSQDYLKSSWYKGASEYIWRRTNHWLLLNEVGTPVHRFKSPRQFLRATHDAFIAHQQAYIHCHVLHRDVSLSNIIFTDDGRGLLIDWEHAKTLEELAIGRPWRAGTWESLSTRLCQFPRKRHQLQDDLESFVHVVIHAALRFMKNEYPPELLTESIIALYEEERYYQKFTLFREGLKSYMADVPLVLPDASPIVHWIECACDYTREWLRSMYSKVLQDGKTGLPKFCLPGPVPPSIHFHSHTALLELWKAQLNPILWKGIRPVPPFDYLEGVYKRSWTTARDSQDNNISTSSCGRRSDEVTLAASSEESVYDLCIFGKKRKLQISQVQESLDGLKKQRTVLS